MDSYNVHISRATRVNVHISNIRFEYIVDIFKYIFINGIISVLQEVLFLQIGFTL